MSLLLTVKRICVISSFPYYFMFLENIGPVAGRCSPTRGRPGSGATAAAGRQDVVTPRHSRRRSHRLMVRGRGLCDQVGVGGRSRAGAAGSAFKLRSPFVAGSRHGRPTCPPLPPRLGAPGSTAELPTSAAFSVLPPPPAPVPTSFPCARPPPPPLRQVIWRANSGSPGERGRRWRHRCARAAAATQTRAVAPPPHTSSCLCLRGAYMRAFCTAIKMFIYSILSLFELPYITNIAS